jgi:peptidoglycan hydrolase-like protein with peptidoglycan-binding domain
VSATRWAAGVVVAALVATGAIVAARSARHASSGVVDVPTSSSAVVRTDLVATTQQAGMLQYPPASPVVNQTRGAAFTALPEPGDVLMRDSSAYEVDGVAVPLFLGTRPMWRDLRVGVTPGADVAELNANLVALGFTDHGRIVVDDHFTGRTDAALRAWQRAHSMVPTGVLHVGDVVYAPAGFRVAARDVAVGSAPEPGMPVLETSATTRAVVVALPVAQQYLVRPGDDVTVTLPDGRTTTDGTVYAIATNAAQHATAQGSQPPGPNANNEGVTVDVTIVLRDLRAAGTYDQAPVVVNIATDRARNVLAVPVNALVALSEGGYAVAVIDGAHSHLVAVQTGMFSNALVEVRGAGLAPGQRVEVPAS